MKSVCERCYEVTDYVVREEKKAEKVNGKRITYTSKEGHCIICGALVYVPELTVYNLKVINEALAV